jgi:hypothetical protein
MSARIDARPGRRHGDSAALRHRVHSRRIEAREFKLVRVNPRTGTGFCAKLRQRSKRRAMTCPPDHRSISPPHSRR